MPLITCAALHLPENRTLRVCECHAVCCDHVLLRNSSSCAEWHPYTLTSAPDDPFLSVHIQVCGDWTSAVYDYLSEYVETTQVCQDSCLCRDHVPC